MNITLWKGWHGPEIEGLISGAWTGPEELLILCPPNIHSFDFVRYLPAGPIQFRGDWSETPSLPSRQPTKYPDAPVLGLFTSGTSLGEQKLVLYSRRNIRASLTDIVGFLPIEEIDTIFCYPQPFHTFGLLLGYVLALEMEWAFFSGEGKYSTSFHERWGQLGNAVLTLGTPTHFQDLLTYLKSNSRDVKPTAACIVGGASVSVELWDRLRDELKIARPSIGYGASEASPGVTHLAAGQRPKQDSEIGVALPGLQLDLIPNQGYRISGKSVCLAIISSDRIEFPKNVMISDALESRADGVLIYRGRTDLVVNRGGEKISIEAVERKLKDLLGVEALAFAVPHARLGFELGLLIQTRPESLVIGSILEFLAHHFQAQFDPKFFREVPQFPMNENHKPDRRAALQLFGAVEL